MHIAVPGTALETRMTFHDFDLHPELLRAVEALGFAQPTAIQADAIPPALAGRDVLACAMTGSGKSAAFLLPILHRLRDQRAGRTRALVLTPTRELAAQVDEHRRLLGRFTRVTGASVLGGVGFQPQIRAFQTGVDILVATPGRLLDLLRHPGRRLDGIEMLVLDEADRLLDMGFLPDVRRILDQLPQKRQSLLFSATLPSQIVELAREMLREPVTLNTARQSAPATGITHSVYRAAQAFKSPLLVQLLESGEIGSVVVFTRTKHRANRLAGYLQDRGVRCALLHGNRSQSQRTEALAGFRRGETRVLVATDIAARGIDVRDLSHVVNFDVPNDAEDYVHRVGRTARAEATGDAITFVAPDEESRLISIERSLGTRIPRLPLPPATCVALQAEAPEIPIALRIAEIRARKSEERSRAAARAERRGAPLGAVVATPAPVGTARPGRRRRRFGPLRTAE
jgi:ATP-dependent RNA helicase RhlE